MGKIHLSRAGCPQSGPIYSGAETGALETPMWGHLSGARWVTPFTFNDTSPARRMLLRIWDVSCGQFIPKWKWTEAPGWVDPPLCPSQERPLCTEMLAGPGSPPAQHLHHPRPRFSSPALVHQGVRLQLLPQEHRRCWAKELFYCLF